MIKQMMLAAVAMAALGSAAAVGAQDRDDRDRGAMHDDRGGMRDDRMRGGRDMRHDNGFHRGQMMRHHHHRHGHHGHGYNR